ncbi:MAG: GDP-mannose 4,6-dehydratase [Chloroflexi bacterium]|jgi:GDP-mannose 4,6-dehydratase|nr:GDP-mannose 4,6-dehydratase [Chloroflexota bacterium]
MRALITGITGFVGSHLAEMILREHPEWKVHGTKRWRSPRENLVDIEDQITLHDCDLTDLSSLIRVLDEVKPDRIFHLAAQSYVMMSYRAPTATVDSNVNGTINLFEALRTLEQNPLIHACSSSEVYGQVRDEDIPIKEDTPFRPASPYAVSKVGEDMAGYMYHHAYGLNILRTRMFTHSGARRGEVFVDSSFARQIARIEAGLQEPVVRVGNLDSVRTFADVKDVVRAYWLLLEKCPPGEVYNIGGETTLTIGQMLDQLLDMTDLKDQIEVMVDPALLRPADVTNQVPSSDKFKAATGWKPEVPYSQTLKDMLEYWRARSKPVAG